MHTPTLGAVLKSYVGGGCREWEAFDVFDEDGNESDRHGKGTVT